MKAIRCIICTIGDEIIDGRTLDTNSQAIARFLASININVTRLLSIGDTANEITSLYAKEAKNFDIIITTGGLGPTEDDKTRQSLGKALKWTFEVNQKWLDYLVQTWGFPKEKLISQALLPENATLIENHHGTSCGFIKQEGEQILIFLPGVPTECLSMLEPIANYLMSVDQNLEIKKKDKICIHGIYEREIDETLQNIRIKNNLNITWGLYSGLTQVKVYIYGTDLDEKMTINLL